MSLYERIQDRGENPWEDDCGFQRVPLELYQKIFKNLNVPDLKASMEVCSPWATAISQFGYLREKSITTWNIDRMSRMDTVNLIRRLAVGEIVILDSGFRLNGILMDNFFLVMLFGMKNNAFEHVTHLEITNSHVRFLMLRLFGTTFKNVEVLVLKDVYIEVVDEDDAINKLNLKTIKISVKDKWKSELPGQRIIIPTPKFAHLFLANQLEEYALEFYDSALFKRPIIDQAEYSGRFIESMVVPPSYAAKTMQGNAKTLKSFSLKTFDLNDDDRVNELNPNYQAHPMHTPYIDIGWTNFLAHLDRPFPNLDFSEMKLEKLTLTFRLIRIGNLMSKMTILPLLRSQTSLKEFTLSQVYFPGDGAGVMHDLLTSLPANCRINLEGVMTLRPNPDHAAIPEPPIQGYLDSTVELITQTVNLTLRFVSCQSLDDIDFFTRNFRYLKKIKIQQPGALPVNKIVLTDPDIQRIITDAPQLTVLWLEFCDLSAITDVGLTGISEEACARMTLTKDFELQDGDIVGSPISAIKNLRSLNLSEVGNHVTDVTAHHGFKGLGGSLTSFGISTPKMTSDGLELLKRLFQYNGVVKFDARRKFDHSLLGEEILAPENPFQN